MQLSEKQDLNERLNEQVAFYSDAYGIKVEQPEVVGQGFLLGSDRDGLTLFVRANEIGVMDRADAERYLKHNRKPGEPVGEDEGDEG